MRNCNETLEYQLNQSLRFILIIVIGMPLICVGIVSSLLSVCMFIKDNMTPKTTKTMLMVTAMLDLIFLILAFFYLELKVIGKTFNFVEISHFYDQIVIPISICLNWCEMFRNWITVLIGLERYLIICHALDFKKWWNLRVTRLGILVCAVISVLLRIPLLIGITTKVKYPPMSQLMMLVHDWIDAIFMTLAPIFILLICSFAIAKQIRSLSSNLSMSAKGKSGGAASSAAACSNEPRASLISNSRINLNNTSRIDRVRTRVHKMLMVVMIIFTICGTPFVINAVVRILKGDLTHLSSSTETTDVIHNSSSSPFFSQTLPPPQSKLQSCSMISRILSVICWFCSITYSTTNFFVYVCYFRKYREIIGQMLLCRCRSADEILLDMQMTQNQSLMSVRGRLMSTADCYSSRLSLCPGGPGATGRYTGSSQLGASPGPRKTTVTIAEPPAAKDKDGAPCNSYLALPSHSSVRHSIF